MTAPQSREARRDARALRAHQLADARATAAQLAARLGLALPVPIDDVAAVLGAEVVIGELPDAMAQLMRWGGRARIRLSMSVAHAGARRFSIAHELGHLYMGHGGGTDIARCLVDAIEGLPARTDEAQANAFAAELLAPAALLGAWIDRVPDLDAARELAERAALSVTAAAVRVCELSRHPCAVVRVRAGRILWAARSATFPAYLPRDRVPGVDAGVTEWIAYRRLPRAPRAVPAATWCGTAAPSDLWINEQSTSLPATSDVLCALWIAPR